MRCGSSGGKEMELDPCLIPECELDPRVVTVTVTQAERSGGAVQWTFPDVRYNGHERCVVTERLKCDWGDRGAEFIPFGSTLMLKGPRGAGVPGNPGQAS